ncbi:TonB-dependent receptor [Phenylobacterium sp. J426]|uniref:TonB-dependent receptor n=1 Tax=Phenylobacterium sp. J426 TaxID=2898439 RepID=UPI0021512D09|nr:TonB-dependent receptor [Phenylobacterium sp. J426]MCR5873006.1 TonB-dependent receptor [Phenylobacterium sp. J426]
MSQSAHVRSLLAASVSSLALAAMAAPALAQDAAQGALLDELVITAEKREQSLQDVPVAVSAFTSERRDVAGITGIQDFVNFTPGMNYSGTDRVSLRGAGRNTFYIGNDPGVASYSDGFYSASSSELFKTPLFIERTEILRGPQGTLYGRNAIGGAINQVSKRPSQEYGGEIRALYGNYDRYRIEGAVSLPVAENLRFKIGASHDDQSKGFIKNIGTANDGATIKRTYYEFMLEAEPTEKLDIFVRYNRSVWDDTMGVGDRLANLTTPYDTTRVFGPIGQLQVNPQFGYTTPNPGVLDPYVQNTNTDGYGQLRGNHVITTTVTYDLGFADLKYIGGFQQYNYQTGGDYDATSRTAPIVGILAVPYFPTQTTDFNEHKRYYSNEINLTSNDDGPLRWILGVYQYQEEYRQRIQLANPNQAQLATPLTLAGTPAAPNPGRNFADSQATLDSKAYAVFGQATYELSDQFAVTAGLRYTKDEKSGTEFQRLIIQSPSIAGGAAAFDVSTDIDPNTPGVQNFRALSDSWDAVTGVLNLDWTPDRDTLGYAKYSRGYKSGGFLLGTLAPDPRADQEQVDAFELGLKKTFAGRLQVNAAAFYNDYKGMQLNLSQLNATGTAAANNFVNVDAEAYGLELEAIWRPIQNLDLSASYGYLHTEITSGCCFYDPADPGARDPSATPSGGAANSNGTALVFQTLKGSRIYQSPKHKFAGNANYTFDFDAGSLILSGTYTWTDETYYQPFKSEANRVKAYDVTDFRILWNDGDDRYTVIGFVKNAFDNRGFTSNGSTTPTAIFDSPPNLQVPTATSPLVQTRTAITRGLIQPRTYGVELQYRF